MTGIYLGYITSIISILSNFLLFIFKLWVGLQTRSIAMIADAWHTLSDSVSSIIVLIGFWISAKPEDQNHPFGHGRAEQIAAIILGTLLSIIGLSFLKSAYGHLSAHQAVGYGKLIVYVSLLSLIIKELLAQISIRVGKKYQYQSLIADGWHHRTDAFTSLLIIIGAFLGKFFWWIDGALGIIISFALLYSGIKIIRESSSVLLGETPSEELTQQILSLIQNHFPSVSNIHHIHAHRYGDHQEVTLHIALPKTYTLDKVDAIVKQIGILLKTQLNIEPTIHVESATP